MKHTSQLHESQLHDQVQESGNNPFGSEVIKLSSLSCVICRTKIDGACHIHKSRVYCKACFVPSQCPCCKGYGVFVGNRQCTVCKYERVFCTSCNKFVDEATFKLGNHTCTNCAQAAAALSILNSWMPFDDPVCYIPDVCKGDCTCNNMF